LRSSANEILREYYDKPKEIDLQLQKILLIETAAKIIKSDIKCINTEKLKYPSLENLEITLVLSFLPASLNVLLRNILVPNNDLKVAAIGNSIVQAARPQKIMSPLQIGLAVQMHYRYRSRHLLDTLNRLGFCSSYNEALRFERNAAASSEETLNGILNENSTLHFVADNVDHNTCTLNGENTMHGMGMVAAVSKGKFTDTPVQRKIVSNEDIKIFRELKYIY
jgi:hypothetical protein